MFQWFDRKLGVICRANLLFPGDEWEYWDPLTREWTTF